MSKRYIKEDIPGSYGSYTTVIEVVESPYNTPKKPSTVLERATQLISEGNWCQGALFNDKDKFCALGAIDWCSGVDLEIQWEVLSDEWENSREDEYLFIETNEATAIPSVTQEAISFLARTIPDSEILDEWNGREPEDRVVDFNDRDERKKKEVVKKFKEAVKLAKSEGR